MTFSYATIPINFWQDCPGSNILKYKNMKNFGREDEAMICLHKPIYVSRLTKELCRFTSYSTSLYCLAKLRDTEKELCY